jgi:DNA polymerase-3 subunit alpha
MENLRTWALEHGLTIKEEDQGFYDGIFEIPGFGHFVLFEGYHGIGQLFDDAFNLLMGPEDMPVIAHDEDDKDVLCQYIAFEFGGEFFYSPASARPAQLNPLRHLGKAPLELGHLPFAHLGVHGKYELLNGSMDYAEWCKKAKFFGQTVLGLCERNTLAGTLPFQLACDKAKIRPVLGETVTVLAVGQQPYEIKLFCRDADGWQNLLRINKAINVDNDGQGCPEAELLTRAAGLVCVLSCDVELSKPLIARYQAAFGPSKLFFQFDTVEYSGDARDRVQLEKLRVYLHEFAPLLPPVLLNDSYYLDKQDASIKPLLNKVAKGVSHNNSEDQHYKSLDESFIRLESLFAEGKRFTVAAADNVMSLDFETLFFCMAAHAEGIASQCTFKIQLGKLHLPSYERTGLAESYGAASNNELFFQLIEAGYERKVTAKGLDDDLYWERLEKEIHVINLGGFIDYFLILWDIVEWCKTQNIMVGVGRGSSGGSLVAYLLGIVELDPVHYKLLFERFLNEKRVKSGLPDIDTDFEAERRDEVKQYMRDKYGRDHVVSIGTYGGMKSKGAIKDLGRIFGAGDHQSRNIVTSKISADPTKTLWRDIFTDAQQHPLLKSFIQHNGDLVHNLRLCLNQPKSCGVHASAVVVTPKFRDGVPMEVYDWMPVKLHEGKLVSEWEGKYIEEAGFLKEDILGLSQLDKFAFMQKLAKQMGKQPIDFHSIPLNDPQVFSLFSRGYNEDVFQFGTPGLKSYSQDVLPENIEDLIAAVALYRPGPMDTGAHKVYVAVKHGRQAAEYDYLLEPVSRNTHGMYVYQEQVMQAMQILGGFDLVEADGVRKAMGKKIKEEMEKYRLLFLKGAGERGCPEDEALKIWEKLETFARYGFNRSHAAAYTIMSYWSQWMKINRPLEFWTAALEFAGEDEITSRIGEINRLDCGVRVAPPDVNRSGEKYQADEATGNIYWSISSIKHVGDVAVSVILAEREENGEFFSLEEFYARVPKSKVNKKALLHMILAGCFDEMYSITDVCQRIHLLRKWQQLTKEKQLPEGFEDEGNISRDYFWTIHQRNLIGLGYLDYASLRKYTSLNDKRATFLDPVAMSAERVVNTSAVVGGIVTEVIDRQSKRGRFGQVLLDANSEIVHVTLWNEAYEPIRDELLTAKGKILFVSGKVVEDGWRKCNVIHSNDYTQHAIL